MLKQWRLQDWSNTADTRGALISTSLGKDTQRIVSQLKQCQRSRKRRGVCFSSSSYSKEAGRGVSRSSNTEARGELIHNWSTCKVGRRGACCFWSTDKERRKGECYCCNFGEEGNRGVPHSWRTNIHTWTGRESSISWGTSNTAERGASCNTSIGTGTGRGTLHEERPAGEAPLEQQEQDCLAALVLVAKIIRSASQL